MASKYTTGIGTPLYMAPEILAKKQYDLKADIYRYAHSAQLSLSCDWNSMVATWPLKICLD